MRAAVVNGRADGGQILGGALAGRPMARPAVRISVELCRGLLGQALRIHAAGLKSSGLLDLGPGHRGLPVLADVVFLDPARNRRNDADNRAAFHAQGEYFRRFDDAGFVADPSELLAASRRIENAGQEIVAVFHPHRRQPANFSALRNTAISIHRLTGATSIAAACRHVSRPHRALSLLR
jgi:hypothetical protein